MKIAEIVFRCVVRRCVRGLSDLSLGFRARGPGRAAACHEGKCGAVRVQRRVQVRGRVHGVLRGLLFGVVAGVLGIFRRARCQDRQRENLPPSIGKKCAGCGMGFANERAFICCKSHTK